MSSRGKPSNARRQPDLIVLDDSSEEDSEEQDLRDEESEEESNDESEEEQRRVHTKGMSREERLLNGLPITDDEDDESADEDDDYDDGDDSYGDGSRAFDRKRRRLAAKPKSKPQAKRPAAAIKAKTKMVKAKMVIKAKPVAARSNGKKRARQSESDSSPSESESSDDDFQRGKTARPPVRKAPVVTEKRRVAPPTRKEREETSWAVKTPQVARKSASVKRLQAKTSVKRRRPADSDESAEDSEEAEEESDESDHRQRRPSQRVEIEISEDSESESESEEARRPPPLKKKKKVAVQKPVAPSKKPTSAPAQATARKTVTKPAPTAPLRRVRSPSPSGSSLASPSPPPSPLHRPTASSSRPSQPQVESPVAAPSRRTRGVDSLAEKMTLAEIQAQEREMARFAAERKRLEKQMQATVSRPKTKASSSSHRPPTSSSNPSRGPHQAPPTHRLQRKDSVSSISSSVSSLAMYPAPNTASKRPPKTLVKKQASSAPSYIPPPLRDGFATSHTPNVVTSVKSAMEASMAVAENVEHTPIAHNTTWRRLRFARAPMNLLPVATSSTSKYGCVLPFAKVDGPELHEFPHIVRLESRADMVLQMHPVKSEHMLNPNVGLVKMQVGKVINETEWALKKCHKARVKAVIREMREHLPLPSQPAPQPMSVVPGSRTKRQLGAPLVAAAVDLAPIERVHAKRAQLKQNRPRGSPNELNRLVGCVRYTLGIPMNAGGEDDSVFERAIAPETVIELDAAITPMRRSCTWISVKTNYRVEDNPILRYIPHLGDKARVNIDPKRYESTTLDKEERIVIEVNDDDDEKQEASGENALGDRLEQWRQDRENLKVQTRSAEDDDVKEYLLCKVIQECGETKEVFDVLKAYHGYEQPDADYGQIQKHEAATKKVKARLAAFHETLASYEENEGVGSSMKSLIAKYLTRLSADSYPAAQDSADTKWTVSHRLSERLEDFESNYVQYPDGKGLRQKPEFNDVNDWYRSLFCRRCYMYDCEHGIENPRRSRRSDPVHPVVRKAGVGLTRPPIVAEEKKSSGNGNENGGVIELASSSSSEDSDDDVESVNEDTQSVISGSVDGDGDGDSEVAAVRRSRRSQTQADSMASANLQVQGVIVKKERRKQQRQQAKQLQKLVRPVNDSEYLDDSYQTILGPIIDKLLSPDSQTTCGEFCWKRPVQTSSSAVAIPEPSAIDQVIVRQLMSIVGSNACVLSCLLRDPIPPVSSGDIPHPEPPRTSCVVVRRFIEQQKTAHTSLQSPSRLSQDRNSKSAQRRHQQSRRFGGLHSGKSELVRRTRMHRAQQEKGREHSYKPCTHDGLCDETCDCMKRGHECSGACSCSRDCANRSQGCKCAPGQCRTKSCTCYAGNRECHPDFCFSCGAHEAAVMEFDANLKRVPAASVDICRNVNLLRGIRKKIGVAFSSTHGWGAYVLEPINKNEFVYEYTGALISDDEAERRGNIYDAMSVSYLFDINSDEVLDAMRKGNKLKFANHKLQKEANLEVKILNVRGEHRIAMYAKWDLHVGDELFFDYGYTNETAPEWSQERAPHNIHYADSDLDEDADDDEDRRVLNVDLPSDDDEDEDEDEDDA